MLAVSEFIEGDACIFVDTVDSMMPDAKVALFAYGAAPTSTCLAVLVVPGFIVHGAVRS